MQHVHHGQAGSTHGPGGVDAEQLVALRENEKGERDENWLGSVPSC